MAYIVEAVSYTHLGGDYNDYPNSGAFCCDGLLQADRTPTPAVLQVKKAFEPVAFCKFTRNRGAICVENRYDFLSLDHLKAMITIENQNEIKMSSTVELDGVKAHERKEIVLFDPQKLFLPECSGDWWLNIRIVYKERPAWAEEEYEVDVYKRQGFGLSLSSQFLEAGEMVSADLEETAEDLILLVSRDTQRVVI